MFAKRLLNNINNNTLKPKIYIIHENKEWIEPIQIAFEKRGWNVIELYMINPYNISIDNTKMDHNAVYFNQCSASCGSRNHNISPILINNYLKNLEINNFPLINGIQANNIELSKWMQYITLNKAGIPTPKTEIFTWPLNIHNNIKLDIINTNKPFIIKHNRSGKGLGVKKFNNINEFNHFMNDSNQMKIYDKPSDNILLFQEYIQSTKPQILRMEYINKELIYAFYSNTSYGFELCPSDVCQIGDKKTINKQNLFTLLDMNKLKSDKQLLQLSNKYHEYMIDNNIDIAGFESILCSETNKWITYDINCCTHYSTSIQEQSGINAMELIVNMAESMLKTKKFKSKL